VGQNTIELWSLKAGGGWIHPIHVHLVVSETDLTRRSVTHLIGISTHQQPGYSPAQRVASQGPGQHC
jgi:hypothetical protein